MMMGGGGGGRGGGGGGPIPPPPVIVTPEDVLESLMNDGTIDAMRLKIINHLKANEELKNTTIKMVEQSKVLNAPGAEKQSKRELFDALRQELESSVLDKASKSVWELILDQNGIGKDINETVEKVFCRLSGREPPLFPPSVEPQSEKEEKKGKVTEKEREEQGQVTEKEKEKEDKGKVTEMDREKEKKGKVAMKDREREEKGKVNEKVKEREERKGKEKESDTPLKKRKFIELNTEEEGDEGAGGSNNI